MSITIINDKNFKEMVLDSKEIVFVDFFGEWCQPCKKMLPILEKFQETSGVKVFKVDIDESPTLAKAYGIRSVPTLITFKEGKVSATWVGLANAAKLETLI